VPWHLRVLWSLRGRSQHTVVAWLIAILSLTAIAATSKVVVDLLRWQASGDAARIVGDDRRSPDQDRINAIVVMQRDSRANIAVLRRIEREGGPLAAHAANALKSIDEARR
jgi:hypothetical protein